MGSSGQTSEQRQGNLHWYSDNQSSQLKMGVLVLKRTSDKLDAVFAGAFLILGLAVFGIYLGAARLTCVPTSCQGRPSSANCARDWVYLSAQCEKTFLAYLTPTSIISFSSPRLFSLGCWAHQ